MPSCAALNCTNRRVKKGANDCVPKPNKIKNKVANDGDPGSDMRTFHRFPLSKPDLLSLWVRRMCRDFFPNKNSLLCSEHFEEQCFDRTGQTVRLRDGAVPTLFDLPADILVREASRHTATPRRQLQRHGRNNTATVASDSSGTDQQEEDVVVPLPTISPSHVDAVIHHDYAARESPRSLKRSYGGPGHAAKDKRSKKLNWPELRKALCTEHVKQEAGGGDHWYCRPQQYEEEWNDSDAPISSTTLRAEEDVREKARAPISASGPSTNGSLLRDAPPPQPPEPTVTVPLPLNIRVGDIVRHLTDMNNKRQQLQKFQEKYDFLLSKVQVLVRRRLEKCEDLMRDASSGFSPAERGAHLLTLRDDPVQRFPPLPPVNPLSQDMSLPLTPTSAWETVTALRREVLNLQVRLMNTRILVLAGDLEMEEAKAAHRSFKMRVNKELKEKKKLQSTNLMWAKIRETQRRVKGCSEGRKTRLIMKLGESLEKIFTPMQMSVLRSGRKPKWAEEDIRRAIKLRMRLGRENYDFTRRHLRIPMPSPKIMPQGAKRFKSLKPLFAEMAAAENSTEHETTKDVRPPKIGKRKRDEDTQMPNSESPAVKRPAVKTKKYSPKVAAVRRKQLGSRVPSSQPAQLLQPSQPPLQLQPYQPQRPQLDGSQRTPAVQASSGGALRGASRGRGKKTPVGLQRPFRPSWERPARSPSPEEVGTDEEAVEEVTRPAGVSSPEIVLW